MTTTIESQPDAKASRPLRGANPKPKAKPAPKPKPKAKATGKARPDASEREVTWPSAVKPSLVLLPAKAKGARTRRKAIRGAIIMSVGILGITVIGYISVAAASAVAQGGLETEMAKTAGHQKILEDNKPVQDFYDGLIQQREAAVTALAPDVSNANILKAVNDANTVGATFASITKLADPGACSSVDPFTPSIAVGCLQISGTAPSISAIGELVGRMSASTEMLTAPYVSESTVSEGAAAFKLSVGYTDKAFSNKGKAFDESAEATDNEPAPATGATQEAAK